MYLIEPKKKRHLTIKKLGIYCVIIPNFYEKKNQKREKNGETNLIITGQKPIYQSENGKD